MYFMAALWALAFSQVEGSSSMTFFTRSPKNSSRARTIVEHIYNLLCLQCRKPQEHLQFICLPLLMSWSNVEMQWYSKESEDCEEMLFLP